MRNSKYLNIMHTDQRSLPEFLSYVLKNLYPELLKNENLLNREKLSGILKSIYKFGYYAKVGHATFSKDGGYNFLEIYGEKCQVSQLINDAKYNNSEMPEKVLTDYVEEMCKNIDSINKHSLFMEIIRDIYFYGAEMGEKEFQEKMNNNQFLGITTFKC